MLLDFAYDLWLKKVNTGHLSSLSQNYFFKIFGVLQLA
jgi:hypothetical protein